MPDYYTSHQLAQTLGIAEAAITALQTKGLLQPTVKDGRSKRTAYVPRHAKTK
jgi:hypothetical protein